MYFIYFLILVSTNNFVETVGGYSVSATGGGYSATFEGTFLVSTEKGFYTHKIHLININDGSNEHCLAFLQSISPPQPISAVEPAVEPVVETSFLFQRVVVGSFYLVLLFYILSGICDH
jgi:hypothetical protein